MDLCFFSVARTTPLLAFKPTDAAPDETAAKAYSIWTNFPDGLKVVSEKEYRSDAMLLDIPFHSLRFDKTVKMLKYKRLY